LLCGILLLAMVWTFPKDETKLNMRLEERANAISGAEN
jgi:hypothetical protein